MRVTIGSLDPSTFGARISAFRNAHPDTLAAGPGCALTAGDVGQSAIVACSPTGVTALAYGPTPGKTAPSSADLTAVGPLPVTASLGAGDDTFHVRPDVADVADGGDGTDTLDSEAVPLSQTPLRIAGFRYSDDGVANDGYVGRGLSQNLEGFENVTGAAGDDVLLGGSAGDTLEGFGGADDIDGKGGDDLVIGGSGVDTVTGGPGDDTLMLRDGERDVVKCEPGTNTYDADLTDDLPTIEKCRPPSPLTLQTGRLNTTLKAGSSTALSSFKPLPSPTFAVGAVKEKPNVVIVSKLLVARKGVARMTLSCPKATTGGCSGNDELLDLKQKLIARGSRHRIAAGKRATVTFRLPRGLASRAGARLVAARIVDKGKLGPKTSGAVLPLAVLGPAA